MSKICTINVPGVPEDVRDEFKKVCVDRKISMRDRTIELLENEIARHNARKRK
jgi:hypothetical protein